jgi:hypothetical protein
MVQTITPVVHGGSRRRWAVSLLLHVVGATASAAALGTLLGGIGVLLGAPWGRGGMLLVAAIGVTYAAREIFGLRVPLPELRKQVPEWWRGALGPRTSAFLYGLALGPGIGTHLRHGTFVAVAAIVIALGDPVIGIIVLGPFGLARALGVAVVSRAKTSAAVGDVGERLERVGAGSLPRIANAIALMGIGVAALISSSTGDAPAAWLWTAALAGTFGWAALAKLVDLRAWRQSVVSYTLPRPVQGVAVPVVPVAEAATAIALLMGSVRIGAVAALLLLAGFTSALVRTGRTGVGSLPCGCFGGRGRRSIPRLITRNVALCLLAFGTLAFGEAIPVAAPGLDDALPGALTVGGLVLAAWVLRRGTALWSRKEIRQLGAS